MAFRVPDRLLIDHKCVMRINSKAFVHSIMEANDLDTSRSYTLSGEYLEDENAAVFSLVDGVILREGKDPKTDKKTHNDDLLKSILIDPSRHRFENL